MKNLPRIIAFLTIPFIISGCALVQNDKAGLDIATQTEATVYINNENKGTTPFTTEAIKPGEYDIRLENAEGSWSKKIRIESGTVYYMNINLGRDETSTSGELVYLEKGRGVGVISSPNGAEVSLDSEKQGFTPYLIQNINEGEHEISIAKDGYEPRTIKINAVKGNKIMIEAMLAKLGGTSAPDDNQSESTPTPTATAVSVSSPSPRTSNTPRGNALPTVSPRASTSPTPAGSPRASSSTATVKGTVTVLDTSTGWLRVRDKAGLEGKEVGKVNSGDTVEYIDQTDNGWTQIVLEDGTRGYVASRFVKVNR